MRLFVFHHFPFCTNDTERFSQSVIVIVPYLSDEEVFAVYFAYISTPSVIVFAEHSLIQVPLPLVQDVGSVMVEQSVGFDFLVNVATFTNDVEASLPNGWLVTLKQESHEVVVLVVCLIITSIGQDSLEPLV